MLAKWAAAAVAVAAACAAHAQDVSVLGGVTRLRPPDDRTYGYHIGYTHEIQPWLAASWSWDNEGHVPGHHRDGFQLQAILQHEVASGLTLGVGAGVYQYFDTTLAESTEGYRNAHGTGGVYSLLATWRPRGQRLFWQARYDHHELQHGLDGDQLMVGLGYRLDGDTKTYADSRQAGHRDEELVLYGGKTIVNSFESEDAGAWAVEYRHRLGQYFRASVGWINEGDTRLVRRNGVTAQGWFEPSFNGDRWTFGVGFGAYFAVDEHRDQPRHVSPLITTALGYNLSPRWTARFAWNRVVSNYDRDSDILLLGAGYRF